MFAAGYGAFSYLIIALTFDFIKCEQKQDDFQRLNNSRDNDDHKNLPEKSETKAQEKYDNDFLREGAYPISQ